MSRPLSSFLLNDPAATEIYTLSLHDALPISCAHAEGAASGDAHVDIVIPGSGILGREAEQVLAVQLGAELLRSEEHTSELQSLAYLVCRLLLEKKKTDEANSPRPPFCKEGRR